MQMQLGLHSLRFDPLVSGFKKEKMAREYQLKVERKRKFGAHMI
jgi:hypothetical protein